jgi:hypothetical protein
MQSIAGQVAALQRIATFSAKLRGHELGEWQMGEGFATAGCVRCGQGIRVYWSLVQPEMEGPALDKPCNKGAAQQAA